MMKKRGRKTRKDEEEEVGDNSNKMNARLCCLWWKLCFKECFHLETNNFNGKITLFGIK